MKKSAFSKAMSTFIERKQYIKRLRDKRRMSFQGIAHLLGVSRQRIQQIYSGYKSPSKRKPAIDHKILTSQKLKALVDIDTHGENPNANGVSGGRDYIREWVRIRDRHTCQVCRKVWVKGSRRLDVHHLDEEREGLDSKKLVRVKEIIQWDKNHLNRMVTLCHKCHLNLDSVRNKMSYAIRG